MYFEEEVDERDILQRTLEQCEQGVKFYNITLTTDKEQDDTSIYNRFVTSETEIKLCLDGIKDEIYDDIQDDSQFPVINEEQPHLYKVANSFLAYHDLYMTPNKINVTFKDTAELLAMIQHNIGATEDTVECADGITRTFRIDGGIVYHALFKSGDMYYSYICAELKNPQLKTPGLWVSLGDHVVNFPFTINSMSDFGRQVFTLKNHLWIIDDTYDSEASARASIDDNNVPNLQKFWTSMCIWLMN